MNRSIAFRDRLSSRWKLYQPIFGLLAYEPKAFGALAVVALLASVTESFGVSTVIPLLQSTQEGESALSELPFLGMFSQWVANLPPTDLLKVVAGTLAAAGVMRGVFSYLGMNLSVLLRTRIDRRLREQVFRQLMDVELRFIYRERVGNLFTILNDFTHHTSALAHTLAQIIINGFFVLIYTAILFMLSWQLTLMVIVLLGLVFYVIRRWFTARLSRAGRELNQAKSNLNSVGFESLSALKLTHLYAKETNRWENFCGVVRRYQNKLYQYGLITNLMKPLFNVANVLILSVLLFVGSIIFAAQAEGWIPMLMLFFLIMFRMMEPVSMLNSMRGKAVSYYPAFQAMRQFLNRDDKVFLESGSTQFRQLAQSVSLDNVNFSYKDTEGAVLKSVTFDIPKGKTTAVIGPSGAGKSTLIDLVARLYDPQVGKILVDGIDLRDLDLQSWRTQIAVVSQDTFIFNTTIVENLRFVKENATENEIHQAAKLADAHDFIMELPQGYDTLLGDRGVRLSGGQQQRISITRALLANPQLLILDEATSNLDSATEKRIQKAIDRISQGRTVLAIAHRLSTIRDAENILVLDNGAIVEQGTHEELIDQGGRYHKMVEMQNLETTASSAI